MEGQHAIPLEHGFLINTLLNTTSFALVRFKPTEAKKPLDLQGKPHPEALKWKASASKSIVPSASPVCDIN